MLSKFSSINCCVVLLLVNDYLCIEKNVIHDDLLTLEAIITVAADDTLNFFICIFLRNTRLDNSHEMSFFF